MRRSALKQFGCPFQLVDYLHARWAPFPAQLASYALRRLRPQPHDADLEDRMPQFTVVLRIQSSWLLECPRRYRQHAGRATRSIVDDRDGCTEETLMVQRRPSLRIETLSPGPRYAKADEIVLGHGNDLMTVMALPNSGVEQLRSVQ